MNAPQQLSLQDQLPHALADLPYKRRETAFFLGTDEHIPRETRVALTPKHLQHLREDLGHAGLSLKLYAMEGSGDRAGFTDADYEQVGATIVRKPMLGRLEGVDVFHALKEPTWYESQIPGPFIRMGALHLASYPPGVCNLISNRNFSAILDGGTIGNCSYVRYSGDRTPIVASMSRFAGTVAGRKVVEGVQENGLGSGRVVVVGAGIAGMSAIAQIRPVTEKLVIVEAHPPARERLPRILKDLGWKDFEIHADLHDDAIADAIGIVFAHRSGAKAAEKVCTEAQIRTMQKGAAIADIAIDQGGSIAHDDYSEFDDALTSRDKYRKLFSDYAYFAEVNMPREMPEDASATHGDASLPYVTSLLALCALYGSPDAATKALMEIPKQTYASGDDLGDRSLLDCLKQDLRNGLQIVCQGDEILITDSDIEKNAALVDWVGTCAKAAI